MNTMMLLAVSDLNRRAANALVSLKARDGDTSRAIWVAKGMIVATESNVVVERLGDMLAAEGRLDPVLIEPVAKEARKRGTLLGNQLVTDGLLSPTDLASALERQARLRFEAALAAPGAVSVVTKAMPDPMVRIPLGSAVTAAFRSRISLPAIQNLIAERQSQPIALDVESDLFLRLEVGPSELRVCRGAAAGQSFEELIASSPAPESATRMIGVLVALGLWA